MILNSDISIKQNFYLNLIIYPVIILILSTILNINSENYLEILFSALRIIFIFIGLNLLGGYYIFKPIDIYLKNLNQSNNKTENLILKLPFLATILFFLVSIIYSFVNLIMMKIQFETVFTIDILLRVFNRNSILGTIFTYFLIENFTIGLKEHIFNKSGKILKEQNNKILLKLILTYITISLSPLLELYFLVYPYLEIENIKVQIVAISSMLFIMIIFSAYIITRGFRKPTYTLLNSFERVKKGNYSPIPITSSDEMGKLAANYNKMLLGLREREFIRDTFGKFVTKEVATKILNSDSSSKMGEMREISIMFTDIANYTTITENMKPEDVVGMLNEYFNSIVRIIKKHNGIVNKFIGDAILVFYNAPVDDPDHAQNAVKAAIEIDNYLKNKKFFNDSIVLKTRMGINTDMVIVGNIGSDDRLEYTVIGDGVNVSARLEKLNKDFGTRILVGENTYEEVKNRFKFEEVTQTKLKGKNKSIKVYKLI